MRGYIEHINPEGLVKNPAFSQIVTTQGNGKTIYIGGQNSVNAKLEIIGKDDLQAQTEQVMQNIQTALSACQSTFKNVVKLNIHLVQGQNPFTAFQAASKFLDSAITPPAITVVMVAGLSHPDFLIEVDATAFLAEQKNTHL
jgi:enamine deaminase RidA (YjgF/YER057c/UK114 family)